MGHHHHQQQCQCACCSHERECHQDECCHHEACEHGGHGAEDFAHELLEMADEAWMEVLRDKIKAQIISTSGAHLDKLAKIVAQSNKERWEHKMAKHQVLCSYRDKLAEYFHKK